MIMDPLKKRKLDENGAATALPEPDPITGLTPQDARKLLERFTNDQLLDILQDAVSRHVDVLSTVRSVGDRDLTQRKLFIRGLGAETTTDGLRTLFSEFGELEEAVVILDKVTGKSKGYGFITFKHVDGAFRALKEPSKTIDGRVTVTQLAAAGTAGGANPNPADAHMRKIYVANVPCDMPSDKLLSIFVQYGEIEEGPLGYDKVTGKSRGFALFVYKTPRGAEEALREPLKTVDGKQLNCKLAIEGKKGKQDGMQGGGFANGDRVGMGGPLGPGAYGGSGGHSGMGPYGGLQGPPPLGPPHNMNSGAVGASSMGAAPVSGGYGSRPSGPYGGYGGAGYGGPPGGGMGGSGAGYRMPSGGYQDGQYNSAFPSQHHPGTGPTPLPRVPPGGMYPNAPYY